MVPETGSWNRASRLTSVVFPAPVGPMMPTRVPGRIVKLASRSAGSRRQAHADDEAEDPLGGLVTDACLEALLGSVRETCLLVGFAAERLDDPQRPQDLLHHRGGGAFDASQPLREFAQAHAIG